MTTRRGVCVCVRVCLREMHGALHGKWRLPSCEWCIVYACDICVSSIWIRSHGFMSTQMGVANKAQTKQQQRHDFICLAADNHIRFSSPSFLLLFSFLLELTWSRPHTHTFIYGRKWSGLVHQTALHSCHISFVNFVSFRFFLVSLLMLLLLLLSSLLRGHT